MKVKLPNTIRKDSEVNATENQTSLSKTTSDFLSKKKKSFFERGAGIIKDISIDDIDKARDEYLSEKYGVKL